MKARSTFRWPPLRVLAGLALAIALDTAVQVFWKFMVLKLPEDAGLAQTLRAMAMQPGLILLVALLVVQLLNWRLVLAHADLSYAQPITALSYVSVTLASALILHETVRPSSLAGVAIVLCGVWFIAGTEHRTAGAGEAGT